GSEPDFFPLYCQIRITGCKRCLTLDSRRHILAGELSPTGSAITCSKNGKATVYRIAQGDSMLLIKKLHRIVEYIGMSLRIDQLACYPLHAVKQRRVFNTKHKYSA